MLRRQGFPLQQLLASHELRSTFEIKYIFSYFCLTYLVIFVKLYTEAKKKLTKVINLRFSRDIFDVVFAFQQISKDCLALLFICTATCLVAFSQNIHRVTEKVGTPKNSLPSITSQITPRLIQHFTHS